MEEQKCIWSNKQINYSYTTHQRLIDSMHAIDYIICTDQTLKQHIEIFVYKVRRPLLFSIRNSGWWTLKPRQLVLVIVLVIVHKIEDYTRKLISGQSRQ